MYHHNLYDKRLTDKLLACIHAACDLEYDDIASDLLATLEKTIKKSLSRPGERRRLVTSTVAAHERLWVLRHKDLQ